MINLVCGSTTGEITSFLPSSDAAGATASVTFVTKYACPQRDDDEVDARQRRKEAERKARLKLDANSGSLKQARLSPAVEKGKLLVLYEVE